MGDETMVQVGICWGEFAVTTEAKATEACRRAGIPGTPLPVQSEVGVWMVSVSPWFLSALLEHGYVEIRIGSYSIAAEMP